MGAARVSSSHVEQEDDTIGSKQEPEKKGKGFSTNFPSKKKQYDHEEHFLGGLSLYLNHLIPQQVEISYRLFGTLPIGLLLSNLGSRQLETSFMTSYDQF